LSPDFYLIIPSWAGQEYRKEGNFSHFRNPFRRWRVKYRVEESPTQGLCGGGFMRQIAISAIVLTVCAFAVRAAGANELPANRFATDLFGHLSKDGNLICSPLSAFAAMSMTAVGARGSTAREMAMFDQAGSGVGNLIAGLEAPSDDFELHVANAIWVQSGFKVSPAFQKDIMQNYRSACFNVDFANSLAACGSINNWISAQTNAKIPELFSPGTLPPDARLVLTNAIYFHADWEMPFSPGRSRLGDFYIPNQPEPAQRMMMHEHGSFPIMHADQFDALELPYKGDRISMLIILPKSRDGLKSLEAGFSPDLLSRVAGGLNNEFVELSIPKFSFDWQSSLRAPLEAMGIKKAFNSTEADFSGISDSQPLFISDVVQKAFVSVDEAGTEAAAATGVLVMPTAVRASEGRFDVDHPFLFVIRERENGAILFTGRVIDPGMKK
jgi:serpin B